jgi:hypothetical protein
MRTLIFHCPRTGRDIVSGIQLDDTSLRCVGELPVTLRCSCGDVHRMRVKDGRVALEPPASPPLVPTSDGGLALPLKRIFSRAADEGTSDPAPVAAPIAFPAEWARSRGSNDNAR